MKSARLIFKVKRRLAMLTTRQQQIFDLIKNKIAENGLPPTRAEIAEIMGFKSINAADDHLKALVRKGVIKLMPGTSRGIVIQNKLDQNKLPLVGKVAAGYPILAEENIEDFYNIDTNFFKNKPDYLLKVVGDSMQNASILDGDFVAVKKTVVANNQDVVVARIDDEVTLKRFIKTHDSIELHPENPNYDKIVINFLANNFAIEGIVVGVLRNSF